MKHYKGIVGKFFAGKVYVHRQYAHLIVPEHQQAAEMMWGRFPGVTIQCGSLGYQKANDSFLCFSGLRYGLRAVRRPDRHRKTSLMGLWARASYAMLGHQSSERRG